MLDGIRKTGALACVLAAAACDSPADPDAGGPAALVVAAGDQQTGMVGAPLPALVRVRIEDGRGRPVQGVPVTWEAAQGQGSAAPATGLTAADGTASTIWSLGPTAGTQQLKARVQNLPDLTLRAEAQAGPPGRITVSPGLVVLVMEAGRDQAALQAVVQDAFDNPLSLPVTWSVPDGTVAEVDQTGVLRALAAGFSSVQARIGNVVGGAPLTVENPVPLVNGAAPGTVTAGAPGATVSLLGTGFVSTSVVLWNGAARPSLFVSNNRLDVELTAADLATARSATLRVTNVGPGGGSADHPFLVEAPVPTLRIIPESAAIGIGERLDVAVEALDADGRSVAEPAITWTFVDIGLDGFLEGHRGGVVRGRGIGVTRLAATWAGMAVDTLEVLVRGTDARLTTVGAGNSLSCGLDAAGAAYCWGAHYLGLDPDGRSTSLGFTFAPAALAGGRVLASMVVGHWHACGLDPAGTAFCWYDDHSGQLGRAQASFPFGSTEPTPVAGGHRFRELMAGGWHTCGVTFDEEAWCWGANQYGQLGVGDQTMRREPTRVAGGVRFRSLFGQGYHTCGLTAQGLAYCWGFNGYGQLGRDDGGTCNDPLYGPVPCGFAPAPVTTELIFITLAVGGSFTCGLTAEGTAWCWGAGTRGQLGDGVTGGTVRPVRVTAPAPFTSIDAGHGNACALTQGGQAWCWGQNDWATNGVEPTASEGCVENNTIYLCNPLPVPVSGGHTFGALSAGAYHTCGMATSGRALCWGETSSGELGRGWLTEGYYAAQPAPIYDGWMQEAAVATRAAVSGAASAALRPDQAGPPATLGATPRLQLRRR